MRQRSVAADPQRRRTLASAVVFPLLEAPERCPVCASDRVRALHVYRNKHGVSDEPYLALVGCEACGVAHSHPLPSEAELHAFYAGEEGWERRTAAPEEESEEEIRAALERKSVRYGRELELLGPHLAPPRTHGGPPRAVDFGCGTGGWLNVLQDAGWETHGLEPGPKAAAIAARRHAILQELPEDGRFDLALVNHVLEHLRDPLETMRRVARAVAPGGQVFVSSPDFGRLPEHTRFGYVKSGVHIMSFTFSGLRSLLALAGLEVEEHFASPEWDGFDTQERSRLKVLARKTGAASFPVEEAPLREVVDRKSVV